MGESALVVTLLTFSLEGASSEAPFNQSTRKRTKKSQKQPKNVKHKRSRNNKNVAHVKNRRREAWKPTKRRVNFWINSSRMDGINET